MTAIFLKLLNMSIAASWLVLAVILIRALLKNAPKWILCLLWGIVALRLTMPFSFESPISLIPSAEVIPLDVATSEAPAIYSGIPAVNSAVNPLFTLHFTQEGGGLEKILLIVSVVWLSGIGIMLLYSVVTYIKLHRRVKVSLRFRDNIYICDHVESAFLLGIFRPRIYVPSGMPQEQMQFVLAHENAHIKRRDHLWKPLGFLLLTVYWFNPLLWVAYFLLCRDIERACDEKVITRLDAVGKVGYSSALAACSVRRRMIMACPVAFGEVSVKTRIKGVLNYKEPAFWIICASVAMCVMTMLCFLTNPESCAHEYLGEITTEATCTQTGIQTQTCIHCKHSYTVSVELAAHTYDSGVVTEESTCTHQGCKLLECVSCGNQITEQMERTDHIAADPMFLKEPNCTQSGERSATCAYCNTVFVTQILPPNDVHDLKETVLKEPTCTSPGEGVYTCSRCGYSESCSYEQLEHHYVTEVTQKATCQRMGAEKITCTLCAEMHLRKTDFGSHDWTDTAKGYSECRVCGMRGGGGVLFVEKSDPQPLFPVVPPIWP